jgi:hypothetical protein
VKYYLSCLLVFIGLYSAAQDTSAYFHHEIDLGWGLGTGFDLNFKPRAYFDVNGHFPSEDSLKKMNYTTFSRFDSHQWFLSYTRWFENRRAINGFQQGVKVQVNGWKNVELSEFWNSSERWTYDTTVNSVTGSTFFHDSIRKDQFSSTFSASHLCFGLGYRLLIPIEERFEFALGMDLGTALYMKKKITYGYKRIEDKNAEDDEFALEDSQNVTDHWRFSLSDDMNMSTYSVIVPIEFRFIGRHAGYGEGFRHYYGSWYQVLRLSLQAKPGYYLVDVDGAKTAHFAISFGLSLVLCF